MSDVGEVVEIEGHRYRVVAISDDEGRFEPGVHLVPGDYWADGLARFHVSAHSAVDSFQIEDDVDRPIRLLKEIP